MSCNETPLGPRILIKIDEPFTETASGLVIPDEVYDRESATTQAGTVVAIGKLAFQGFGNNEPWVKVGQKVTFVRHSGVIRKIEGDDYRVVNDTDLLTEIHTKKVEAKVNE